MDMECILLMYEANNDIVEKWYNDLAQYDIWYPCLWISQGLSWRHCSLMIYICRVIRSSFLYLSRFSDTTSHRVAGQPMRKGFNTLRPRQNRRHFADSVVKCIFLDENVWISNNISLKVVPNDQYSSTGSDIGLAPSGWQAIIWTNDS